MGGVTADDHRYWREMLGAFVLGELDEERRVALQAHLEGCEHCRAELREIQSVAAALARTAPERVAVRDPTPPSGLMDRTLANIDEARRAEEELRSRRRWRILQRSALAVAAAAFLVVLVVFALLPQITSPPLEPVVFSDKPAGVKADADLIDHTWGVETILVVSGLEEGETYKLTLQRENGPPVPSGTFISTGEQPVECRMNAALLRENATSLEIRTADGDLILVADLPEKPAEKADSALGRRYG